MPGALLLAFEKGYNTIPGVIAQDVTTWGEMKQIFRELKKPEVQEVYKTIIIDTVDVACDLCQKYICSQLGIDQMGEGGWGVNSWPRYKKEFEDVFRGLTMMGYAVVFISHSKSGVDKDQNGREFGYIKPTTQSSALQIIENMADIYAYARSYVKTWPIFMLMQDLMLILLEKKNVFLLLDLLLVQVYLVVVDLSISLQKYLLIMKH